MGMKQKIVDAAASKMMNETGIAASKVLESIHAHLEKQLECQRLILNELRHANKRPIINFKDEKQ